MEGTPPPLWQLLGKPEPTAKVQLPKYIVTSQEAALYEIAARASDEKERRQAAAALGYLCPAFYVHNFLWIKDEDKQLQPFNWWNYGQWRIYDQFALQYYRGQPVRVIVLKPRQMGSTTFFCALDYWATATRKNSLGMLLAQEEGITKRIFQMFHRYHGEIVPWMRPSVPGRPTKKHIEFDNLGSSIFVDTAGKSVDVASKVGRGDTFHLQHLTEFDHFSHQEDLLLACTQGLPEVADSFAWYESTPNGQGNFMDGFWERSVRGHKDDSGFNRAYICWKDIPYRRRITGKDERGRLQYAFVRKYSRDLPLSPQEYRKTVTAEEYELVDLYGLTLNQLEFRRFQTRVKCGRDPEKFRQEYSLNPKEAFIGSGESVFLHASLSYLEREAAKVKPSFEGRMAQTGDRVWCRPSRPGPLYIYRYPVEGHSYTIGYDPSAGYENSDGAAISVLDRNTLEFVAHYKGKEDVPVTAEQAAVLGWYYNDAMVNPDVTGIGMAAIWALRRQGYTNIYRRKDPRTNRKRSSGSAPVAERFGIDITNTTRPLLVADLREAIDQRQVAIYDDRVLWEARRFHVVDGKEQHARNAGDDLLFSCALALRAHKDYPLRTHQALKAIESRAAEMVAGHNMREGYGRPTDAYDILGPDG